MYDDGQGGHVEIAARVAGGVSVQVGAANISAGEFSLGTLSILGAASELVTSDIVQVGKESGDGTTTAILTVGDFGRIETGELRILEGGILTGDAGSVAGNTIINLGGILAVGASPGTMTFENDLIFSGGLLDLEIGASGFDFINVLGDLFIEEPFDLNVTFLDDYLPSDGDTFDFFSVGGSVLGDFSLASVSFFGLSSDYSTSFDFSGGFSVSIENSPAPVPLPAGLPLLLTCLGGLAWLKRRKHV